MVLNFEFKDVYEQRLDGTKLNLVLFGYGGSGKSAFVNSLHFAISGWVLRSPHTTRLSSRKTPRPTSSRAGRHRTRNSFSHDSSGPPVRTHLHTANQSYMIWIVMTCVLGIRVRMRVDLLFSLRWGKEERIHARCACMHTTKFTCKNGIQIL